ncbi:MAG: hypothetical protein IJ313_10500 [Clostridia bacterium]|nr:hypothetical protein [Clostridia bacterium]
MSRLELLYAAYPGKTAALLAAAAALGALLAFLLAALLAPAEGDEFEEAEEE